MKGYICGADPYVRPDTKDDAILQERLTEWYRKDGPRVGDYIIFADGKVQRFSHDWGEDIQTSESGSFFMGKGYISFSGGLNPPIKKTDLIEAGQPKQGNVWFFHHDYYTAHNAVHAQIPCRVYTTRLTSDHWKRGAA